MLNVKSIWLLLSIRCLHQMGIVCLCIVVYYCWYWRYVRLVSLQCKSSGMEGEGRSTGTLEGCVINLMTCWLSIPCSDLSSSCSWSPWLKHKCTCQSRSSTVTWEVAPSCHSEILCAGERLAQPFKNQWGRRGHEKCMSSTTDQGR